MKKEWEVQEIDFLKENYDKMPCKEIGKKLNRTRNSVQCKAHKLGLKHAEKYSYNKSFFKEIDTEEKAYWLGFFYADGYVCKTQTNAEASIMLGVVDKDHLSKFNKSIDGNVEVAIIEKGNGFNDKITQEAVIRLYSVEIVNDLIRHGCFERKTFNIKFPKLHDDLQWAFIRGFFDGDGCIMLEKKRNLPRCDFTSASYEFLEALRKYLYSYGINSVLIKQQGSTWRLQINGMESNAEFLDRIYMQASIYLNRKYVRYTNYFEQCNIRERIKNNKGHHKKIKNVHL